MYVNMCSLPLFLSQTHTQTQNSLSVEDTAVWSGYTDALTGHRPKDKEEVLEFRLYLHSGYLCQLLNKGGEKQTYGILYTSSLFMENVQ